MRRSNDTPAPNKYAPAERKNLPCGKILGAGTRYIEQVRSHRTLVARSTSPACHRDHSSGPPHPAVSHRTGVPGRSETRLFSRPGRIRAEPATSLALHAHREGPRLGPYRSRFAAWTRGAASPRSTVPWLRHGRRGTCPATLISAWPGPPNRRLRDSTSTTKQRQHALPPPAHPQPCLLRPVHAQSCRSRDGAVAKGWSAPRRSAAGAGDGATPRPTSSRSLRGVRGPVPARARARARARRRLPQRAL